MPKGPLPLAHNFSCWKAPAPSQASLGTRSEHLGADLLAALVRVGGGRERGSGPSEDGLP